MRAATTALDQLLTPIGFTRTKATWTRPAGPFIDVIDYQTDKSNTDVTLNCGVLDPEVYSYCWLRDPPARIQEPDCTVRARVGDLRPDRRDIWWPRSDGETAKALADAVAEELLPFVERMHSREAMAAWLEETRVVKRRYPPPIIYLAVLRFLAGDTKDACELLRELHAKATGPWQERVGEILVRLECDTASETR
jgi:hypothetical protein